MAHFTHNDLAPNMFLLWKDQRLERQACPFESQFKSMIPLPAEAPGSCLSVCLSQGPDLLRMSGMLFHHSIYSSFKSQVRRMKPNASNGICCSLFKSSRYRKGPCLHNRRRCRRSEDDVKASSCLRERATQRTTFKV